MAGAGKPENPMKAKVVAWVEKTHASKPFRNVNSALEAASAKFENLPTTARQWVMAGMGVEAKKRAATGASKRSKKSQEEVFTFDIALQQIEAIKVKMVVGLRNQYKAILAAESELEAMKAKLEADIKQCAKITGTNKDDISAQLEAVQ